MTSTFTSLAFYLPQFHEIPENNEWWGPGFTEWTNLRNAKSLSKTHALRRPMPPLGEYRLTDPAVMEMQWDIASRHGISGFAVWDYWFGGGKQLLEGPIEMVLREKLKFKYCLAWANHSWYDKSRNRLLCAQHYLGTEDYKRYFDRARRHFETDNYILIDGKPVFIIFNAYEIPDFRRFLDQWHEWARACGFPGMYFVADRLWEGDSKIDALDRYSNAFRFLTRRNKLVVNYLKEKLPLRISGAFGPRRYDFAKLERDMIPKGASVKFAPTVLTGWDTTARHGGRGVIFENLGIDSVERQLELARKHFEATQATEKLLFVKSWNEWAEGNVLEPDSVFGYEMLQVFKAFSDQMTIGAAQNAS